jgi:hypothetical protein
MAMAPGVLIEPRRDLVDARACVVRLLIAPGCSGPVPGVVEHAAGRAAAAACVLATAI